MKHRFIGKLKIVPLRSIGYVDQRKRVVFALRAKVNKKTGAGLKLCPDFFEKEFKNFGTEVVAQFGGRREDCYRALAAVGKPRNLATISRWKQFGVIPLEAQPDLVLAGKALGFNLAKRYGLLEKWSPKRPYRPRKAAK